MKAIHILLAAILPFSSYAETSCSEMQERSGAIEMAMAKRQSVSWRFCNTKERTVLFENSIVTTDGGVDGEREMVGFVVDDIIEFPPCECRDLLVARDKRKPLEHEVGFFWLKMQELVPVEYKSTNGRMIPVTELHMPAFTYGYEARDTADLKAQIKDGKVFVSNKGKRPGRVLGALVNGKMIEFQERFFIRPNDEVDITKDIPFSVTSLSQPTSFSIVDVLGREIPMR